MPILKVGKSTGETTEGKDEGMEKKKKKDPLNRNDFRAELKKVLPGYKWIVHQAYLDATKDPPVRVAIRATGTFSKGMNRMSTVKVKKYRRKEDGRISYSIKSAGFGVYAQFHTAWECSTLKQAVQYLQEYYKQRKQLYAGLEWDIENGRKKVKK